MKYLLKKFESIVIHLFSCLSDLFMYLREQHNIFFKTGINRKKECPQSNGGSKSKHIGNKALASGRNGHSPSGLHIDDTEALQLNIQATASSDFHADVSMKKVVILEGVDEIRANRFRDCTMLKEVIILSDACKIGASAFSGCTNLMKVSIPYGIKKIEQGAFYDCVSMAQADIPDSVTTIENCAFYNCIGITSLVIPPSVQKISPYAFSSCTGLQKVYISGGVSEICHAAFDFCTRLKVVDIQDGVSRIGQYAFDSCHSLSSVNIPSSVAIIQSYAFNGCKSLKSIVIPTGVTEIGTYAFNGCDQLEEVFISSSVKHIRYGAFKWAPSHLRIICEDPSKLSMTQIPMNLTVISYKKYINDKCIHTSCSISDEEAVRLFRLIESRKLESDQISRHDICKIFPSRPIADVKNILQCVGFNLDAFELEFDLFFESEAGATLLDPLNMYLEHHLPKIHLNMFRQAVGNKSCTLNQKSKDEESNDHAKRSVEGLSRRNMKLG